jgi:membrane protein required for beta-lactamase induction
MTDTAAKLRMQIAAKRLRHAGDCGSAPGSVVEAVNEYRAACYAYHSGRWHTPTKRERRAVKRAKCMLTYPPSEAALARGACFATLELAAFYRGWGNVRTTKARLTNARNYNTVAKNNGFYLP